MAVIRKWLGKGSHVVGLGISLDEFQRMRNDSGYKNIVNEYPLIDLKLTRSACIDIIKSEGLPVPPKSSCWFCPFHNMAAWQEIRRNKPELFQKAVELEVLLNDKRAKLKRDKVWLTQKARPLSQVVADQPLLFAEEEPCDSGYCMV
jgi:PP-loop superfamily ATP-utilizing enzyme